MYMQWLNQLTSGPTQGLWIEKGDIMAISEDARKYCPNPKNTTEGLRLKPNGVWERGEMIQGKRKSFSSKDPVEVWKKRAQYMAVAQEEKERAETEQNSGPLFEDVADRYEEQLLERKYGTQRAYLPALKRARERFRGQRMKEIEPWEIKAFLNDLDGMAHTTVSNQKTVVNAIFQLYIDDPQWHGDHNPSKMTAMPRSLRQGRREPPKDDQVQIVKNAIGDPDALPAIIYLCTGERRGAETGNSILVSPSLGKFLAQARPGPPDCTHLYPNPQRQAVYLPSNGLGSGGMRPSIPP